MNTNKTKRVIDDLSFMNKHVNLFRDVFEKNSSGISCIVKSGKMVSSLKVEFYDDEFNDQQLGFMIMCIPYKSDNSGIVSYQFRVDLTRKENGTGYVSNSVTSWIYDDYFEETLRNMDFNNLMIFCKNFNRWNEDWLRKTKLGYGSQDVLTKHNMEMNDWQTEFTMMLLN